MSRPIDILATMHQGEPISPEVAMLLGVPFTWARYREDSWVFKFVATDTGLALFERQMRSYSSWRRMTLSQSVYIAHYLNLQPLYRVTFHDEEGPPCKP